jgi:hypothetical protein
MLNHDHTPYRWQDHVITPRHTAVSLIATTLIVIAVAGAALLNPGGSTSGPHAVVATEWTPPLAEMAKPPPTPRPAPDEPRGC